MVYFWWLLGLVLRDEEGLHFVDSEGIGEAVILLELLIGAQIGDNLLDLIYVRLWYTLVCDGCAEGSEVPVGVLDLVAVDDTLDGVMFGIVHNRKNK